MEQSWPRKNPEIQQEQDSVFIESANPNFFSKVKELNSLLSSQDTEIQTEVLDISIASSESLTPEQIAYNKELVTRLDHALLDPKILTKKERDLLHGYFFEEKSNEELANIHGVDVNTIRAGISNSMLKLRGSKYFRDLKPTTKPGGQLKV